MKYLNNRLDYFKRNILDYNVDSLSIISSFFYLSDGFYAIISLLIICWFLFYKNIQFSQKTVEHSRFSVLEKHLFIITSIVIGLFYVTPYIIYKMCYFDFNICLYLLIRNFISQNKAFNDEFIIVVEYIISNNYPNELIESKLFWKWKNEAIKLA